jgi:AcrR family transcriptional regulator
VTNQAVPDQAAPDQVVRRRKPSAERTARYLAERGAIVDAAYTLLGGSTTTASVHDILREAGLSTRAFYRHFPSKDDLVLFMYRADSALMTARLTDAVARTTTPVEAIDAWVTEYLGVAYNPRRAAKGRVLASHEAAMATGFAEVCAHEGAIHRQILQTALEAGLRDGSLPYSEPEEDAYALHALASNYVGARLFGTHTVSFERARNHTVGLFLRSLGPPAASSEKRPTAIRRRKFRAASS